MFDFRPDAGTPKPEAYRQLLDAAEALTAGERDSVANMANVAALLWDFLPQLNWAGFYRMVDGELVLGPFMGRPACIRIPLGKGVCGTAASEATTQLVEDSPEKGRFDQHDAAGIEALAAMLAGRI